MGSSGIEIKSIPNKREGESHARRTPKKKAFSQLREEAMVRPPPRDPVFAPIPGSGFRLIAAKRVACPPFLNRATAEPPAVVFLSANRVEGLLVKLSKCRSPLGVAYN
jgi:hypothetical protein